MNVGRFFTMGIALFWAGFVCAISFMEAWLKFRAEGVTLTIGLSIGRKVFQGLNRVVWSFFLLFTFVWFSGSTSWNVRAFLPTLLLLLLLL